MTGEISALGRGLRTGLEQDPTHHSIVPPLYPSTNYAFTDLGVSWGYEYGRSANPTRDLLADAINTLEGGAAGVVTASGLGAMSVALPALVPAGGRVLAPHDCYGGSWRLLNHLSEWAGLQVEYVDQTDAAATAAALAEPADLVLVETPSNPRLRLVDLAEISSLAHAAGALVLADNTFCSPLRQRPIEFGADVVLHSTTKFINGHSDVVGGALIAADTGIAEKLRHWANVLGLTASPWDSWLTLRGLRTLDARVRVHDANARQLAEQLVADRAVAKVHYPGLPDHPWHELAARQQTGFGSMITIELHGGLAAAKAFCQGLRVFSLAESLGGVESLIAHPATMTHAAMSPEALAGAGITDGMLRLSVGIEPVADLAADLAAAGERAARVAAVAG